MLLSPIIQIIADILFEQAIRHGPRVIKKFHRHVRFPRHRRGFVSRTGLVAREGELQAIRAALAGCAAPTHDKPSRLEMIEIYGLTREDSRQHLSLLPPTCPTFSSSLAQSRGSFIDQLVSRYQVD